MKKIALIVLILMMLLSACAVIAEDAASQEILTVENCAELAEILKLKNPADPKIEEFAKNFSGKIISFDANIADVSNRGDDTNRYDILIYCGDYSDEAYNGPKFKFLNIRERDLGIRDAFPPSYIIRKSSNVRITGRVKEYISPIQLILLDPILVEMRIKSVKPTISDDAQSDKSIISPDMQSEQAKEEAHYKTLKNGSSGYNVKVLQKRLIELRYLRSGSADGKFGNKTKSAVERFQSANGLKVTGVADDATQNALYSEDAIEAKLSISKAGMVIGSNAMTEWNVDGQSFTLRGKQTKTVKTAWGTYRFDAFGNYEKIGD